MFQVLRNSMNVRTKARSRVLWVFVLILSVFAFAQVFYLNHAYAFDVTLGWDPNTETNMAGYKVYYGTTQGGPYNGSGSNERTSPILVPVNRLANVARPECTVRGLPDGTYYFVITAYNTQGLESGYSNEVRAQAVAVLPVLSSGDGSITISYSESNLRNAALASNYSFNNGLLLSGNGTDTSGTNKVFKFPVNPGTLQRYVIYTMQISSDITDSAGNAVTPSTVKVNDDDNDGMADDWEILYFRNTEAKNGAQDTDGDGMPDRSEYDFARQKWGQWPSWWELDPTRGDSDGDGIPDKYEVDYGLNPVDPSDRNLDLDGDGWTNHEEYLAGYSANNANSPVPAPPQIVEVIPAGDGPVPSNSAFAVRLEATRGINIVESSGVTVTINDGTQIYTRSLNDTNANGAEIVKAIPLDPGVTTFRDLWIVYYRSNETAMTGLFPSGGSVQITVEAEDVGNARMSPRSFAFRIQTEAEEDEEGESLPHLVTMTDEPAAGLTTSRVMDTTSELHGAAIIYDSSLPSETGIVPYLGPTDEVPNLNITGHTGVGLAMNLLPPSVFPDGVTLLIPCPGYRDVGGLSVFYHNGTTWVKACDPAGIVQPGGVGWMVPGSRVNHNNGDLSYIQIDVYHFSAAIAATTSGTRVETEGVGCFISALGGK